MSRVKPPCELKVLRVRECPADLATVDTPETAADYWRTNLPQADWYDPDKEAFVVLLLNTRRRVLGHSLVSLGTVDSTVVAAREVFRSAISLAASAVIVMHNHPSGDPTPSEADIRITRELVRGGQILRIDVLDHVIVGVGRQVSLRELGYLG